MASSHFMAAMQAGVTGSGIGAVGAVTGPQQALPFPLLRPRRTSSANDMRGLPMPPYGFLRHGSDEHGFGARAAARSLPAGRKARSRDGRDLPDIRSGPAGVQERTEWLDALQDVKERISTVETTQRSHAQSIAGNSALINEVNLKLGNATEDIANYKTYIQGCLFSDTTSVQNSFNALDKKVYEFTKLLTDVLQVKIRRALGPGRVRS